MRTAALVFALATGCAFAAEPAPNKALNDLFDREFKRGLEEHPEQATFLGMPGYDDRLTDLSNAAVARRKAHVKEVGVELGRFDPKTLNTQDISRAIPWIPSTSRCSGTRSTGACRSARKTAGCRSRR
jgi:uncharacterized protein (DUF885 family)